MVKPVWNNAQRVNHQNFAKMNLVPRAVLMKSSLVSVNTARQVNTAHSKTTVNASRPMSYLSKTAHLIVKRPIHNNTSFKNSNINQRVNTVKDKHFNTARPKAVVNVVKGNNLNDVKASAYWVWKPKHKVLVHVSKYNSASITLKKFDYVDAQGRSKELCPILQDYEEIDGDMLLWIGIPNGGKITEKSRTPQQNEVAERRNRTLIKADRTMLADSKLPTTFWAKAVNTACYGGCGAAVVLMMMMMTSFGDGDDDGVMWMMASVALAGVSGETKKLSEISFLHQLLWGQNRENVI
ncbi:putative ribonuclease H-like domain-containing protein [Tanacetum coccineum]